MDIPLGLLSDLRDQINRRRMQHTLLQNNQLWHKLCSALDAAEDTQMAADAYKKEPESDDTGRKYLLLYGLLNIFTAQQDALKSIYVALGYECTIKVPFDIRDIRVEAVGHPTDVKDKSHCFIVQTSISKNHFEYHKYGSSFERKRVNLPELIEKQEIYTRSLLMELIEKLKADDKEHKKKFQTKLGDIFPETIDYYFEKVREGLTEKEVGYKEYGKIHLQLVSSKIEEFRNSLRQRNEFDCSDLKYVYEEIGYPLQQLNLYFSDPLKCEVNCQTLLIFNDFIHTKLKDLRQIAQEIDNQYAVQD